MYEITLRNKKVKKLLEKHINQRSDIKKKLRKSQEREWCSSSSWKARW